jgi:Uma2 family endonuclease
MVVHENLFHTFEEYLIREEQAQYKSEYRRGKIVAMAGASLAHNRIVGNLHAALYNALQTKPCAVFMNDLRLWIEPAQRAVYPDVMVICGEPELVEGRTDTVTNPKVVIEVLSKSTAEEDRSDKFHAYWTLQTFEEYILVDQYRTHVEYFRRVRDKQWELLIFTKLNDLLTLKSIAVEISLDQIYRNITFRLQDEEE